MIQSPRTAGFADLWYRARAKAETAVPTKTGMPLKELAPYMSNLSMFKHEPDGRACYTLFGTELTTIFGSDLTGEYFGNLMSDEARAAQKKMVKRFRADHGRGTIPGHYIISKSRTSTGRLIELENISLPYREISDSSIRYISIAIPLTTLDFGEGVAERLPDTAAHMFNAEGNRPPWLHQDQTSVLLLTKSKIA